MYKDDRESERARGGKIRYRQKGIRQKKTFAMLLTNTIESVRIYNPHKEQERESKTISLTRMNDKYMHAHRRHLLRRWMFKGPVILYYCGVCGRCFDHRHRTAQRWRLTGKKKTINFINFIRGNNREHETPSSSSSKNCH